MRRPGTRTLNRRHTLHRPALALTAALLVMSVATAAPPGVEPGEWRVTWHQQSIKSRQAIPPRFLDAQTVTDSPCLDRVPLLPLPPGMVTGCDIQLESAVGETIAWRGACSGNARVTGRIRYRGAALDGTLTLDTEGVTLVYEVKGSRRSAACR